MLDETPFSLFHICWLYAQARLCYVTLHCKLLKLRSANRIFVARPTTLNSNNDLFPPLLFHTALPTCRRPVQREEVGSARADYTLSPVSPTGGTLDSWQFWTQTTTNLSSVGHQQQCSSCFRIVDGIGLWWTRA